MARIPQETINENRRKLLEWKEKLKREPWRKENAIRAGGSVTTKQVIDSQEICRIVRGKA